MSDKASGRFFVKKLRKKLLLVWAVGVAPSRHARGSGQPRLFHARAAFAGKAGTFSATGLRTKVFCGAPHARVPFLQKSDRLLESFQ
jgi:hypothetical protein